MTIDNKENKLAENLQIKIHYRTILEDILSDFAKKEKILNLLQVIDRVTQDTEQHADERILIRLLLSHVDSWQEIQRQYPLEDLRWAAEIVEVFEGVEKELNNNPMMRTVIGQLSGSIIFPNDDQLG
ncbi:hypothetical protein [Candidatus Tisiphia endosymbiont of Nemotelus uliginosus]|uniref:hypothetical protein n=1 Tax=Candidatus Tisiphia endosymbiont of Nemotelus uliginosus TaxID=3077926 RepID=UPI0035C88D15